MLLIKSILTISFSITCSLSISAWATDPQDTTMNRSLVFRDTYEEPDCINFLATKYKDTHEIISSSAEMPKNIDAKAEEAMAKLVPHKFRTREEAITGMMMLFGACPYDPKVCLLDEKMAKAQQEMELFDTVSYFKSMEPLSACDALIYSTQQQTNRTVADDLLIGAQQINNLQITQGVYPILFLGRTPCLVQLAYEEICNFYHPERIKEKHIFHLNFSGTPDIENIRADYKRNSDESRRSVASNLVSPEKREFYFEYMDVVGMDAITTKFYLVDMIGTGASLNSFLRIARYYYQSHLGRKIMPDIEFLALNLNYTIPAYTMAFSYIPNKQEIIFNHLPDLGIRPLKIKTTPLHLSIGTIATLDNGIFEELIAHGISFSAQRWRDEFIDRLQQGAEFSTYSYTLLRPVLQHIIKEQDHIYKQEVAKIIN